MKNVNTMSAEELVQEVLSFPTYAEIPANMERELGKIPYLKETTIKETIEKTTKFIENVLWDSMSVSELRDLVEYGRSPLGQRMMETQNRINREMTPKLQELMGTIMMAALEDTLGGEE